MTPVQSQVAYFMGFMKTKAERRCWWPHFKARAELLEKDFPEYAGLTEALKEALRTQQPEKPAR